MRILVPLDGTPLSELALTPAAELASHTPDRSEIVLLNVFTTSELVSAEVGAVIRDRREYLEWIRQTLRMPDDMVDIAVKFGVPAQVIAATARRQKADLIIMASHVLSEIESTIWGSVAEAIAGNTGIPTLVLRSDDLVFSSSPRQEHLTILVAMDHSPQARAALQSAQQLARALDGKLVLLQALDHIRMEPAACAVAEETAKMFLGEMARAYGGSTIPTECLVVWGDPLDEIATQAQSTHADIIALGTHDIPFSSSVPAHVFHTMNQPVLIAGTPTDALAFPVSDMLQAQP